MKRRKDGRWQKVIKDKGKPLYFYSRAKTEAAAERDIAHQQVEYERKLKATHLFPVVAEKWLTDHLKRVPYHNYKKANKAAYERIKEFFKDDYVEDIEAADIQAFLDRLIKQQYSYKTIANHKSVIGMIMHEAVMERIIKHNPIENIKLPSHLPRSPRLVPEDDVLDIVSSHYKGFDLLPYFLLFSGLRKSEALAIKLKDLDFKRRLIKVRYHLLQDGLTTIYEPFLKTDAAYRDVIMLDRIYDVLPKNFNGFLFSMNGDGKEPLTQGEYENRMNNYCERYGINIGAHQLRHGFATMLYEAGIGDKDAQDLMGHADIITTRNVYTSIRNRHKEETAKKLNAFNF